MAGNEVPYRRSRERSGRTCLRRFRAGTRRFRWRGYTAAWPIPPRCSHRESKSLPTVHPSGWHGTGRNDVLRNLKKNKNKNKKQNKKKNKKTLELVLVSNNSNNSELNTFTTGALAVEFIALGLERSERIALAGLTAFTGSDLPVIGDAAVARESLDVGQTRALTRFAVAFVDAVYGCDGAKQVADARRALLVERLTVVSFLAVLAGETFRVEEALLALAGATVAVTWF